MMIIVETCHGASLRVEDTPPPKKTDSYQNILFFHKKIIHLWHDN